jgi:hypothetical protein
MGGLRMNVKTEEAGVDVAVKSESEGQGVRLRARPALLVPSPAITANEQEGKPHVPPSRPPQPPSEQKPKGRR